MVANCQCMETADVKCLETISNIKYLEILIMSSILIFWDNFKYLETLSNVKYMKIPAKVKYLKHLLLYIIEKHKMT